MVTEPQPGDFGPVLVGLRGSGKSTIGPLVAAATGLGFVDADATLEEEVGQQIREIFAARGEAGFRELERTCLHRLLARGGVVLAGGGGAVVHASVRPILCQRFTVWLHAELPILARRIAGSERPSLTGRPPAEELEEVFQARKPLYEQVAAIRLDCSRATASELAENIAQAWQASCAQGGV